MSNKIRANFGTDFKLNNESIIKRRGRETKVTKPLVIRSIMLEGEKNHIKKARAGNKESFGALYDYYLPSIYRFIAIKVSNRAEAEDLTHEVFLNAWKNIGSYREKGFPFSSWLYQIAKNAVIDSYRTAKKNLPIETVSEEFLKLPNKNPEELNATLELEGLKKCLLLLKSEYQDVIIMRFVEDLSHEEIATALGKSQGAVRLLQHRALKELKTIYENEFKNYGAPTHEA